MMIVHEASYREIANHPGYRIGDDGTVWSGKRGEWRRLKPWKNKGYEWVRLGSIKRPVHQLVLEAFTGPRPSGMEACHENDVKDDNRAVNLRWGTHQSNISDLRKAGRLGLVPGGKRRGQKTGLAKLNESQVREIRSLCGTIPQSQIAKMYSVSQQLITRINTRQTWGWLP